MVLKLITTSESGENSRRYINKLAPSGLSLGTSETDTHRLIFPLNLRWKIHSSYQKAHRLPEPESFTSSAADTSQLQSGTDGNLQVQTCAEQTMCSSESRINK